MRVMDDLATTERSRWEVWHEIHHGRFPAEELVKIAFEEYQFIRKDLSTDKKIVQVKWTARTAKWYPVALKLMIILMTNDNPCEFATEYLLPFTIEDVRASQHPWETLQHIDPGKVCHDNKYVERLCTYFAICGSVSFARTLAARMTFNLDDAEVAFRAMR